MRDYSQTPKMEQQSRSSEIANRRSKKPQKFTNKSLNAAFTSVSEDTIYQKTTDSDSNFSPVSEISDGATFTDQSPDISASLETFDLSDIPPSSEITTDHNEGGKLSTNHLGLVESNHLKMKSVEAEVVADHLRQVRFQILNSAGADLRKKKLVDAVIKIMIEEFYGLPDGRDCLREPVSAKGKGSNMFLFFLFGILCVLVVFVMTTGDGSSYCEPPPT